MDRVQHVRERGGRQDREALAADRDVPDVAVSVRGALDPDSTRRMTEHAQRHANRGPDNPGRPRPTIAVALVALVSGFLLLVGVWQLTALRLQPRAGRRGRPDAAVDGAAGPLRGHDRGRPGQHRPGAGRPHPDHRRPAGPRSWTLGRALPAMVVVVVLGLVGGPLPGWAVTVLMAAVIGWQAPTSRYATC
ncbi:MAG TPA: hypothetical protein VFX16_26045 [Pseudonocardiaceae bacterium]|nr:hypothetical protein [Pseudonocardiaceae bacterium]